MTEALASKTCTACRGGIAGPPMGIYLGESSAPEVEAEILDRVGTYGRQLGQITDAMIVLLRHLPHRANLAPEEREAIEAFEKMANDIANIKEKHKRQAVRPSTSFASREVLFHKSVSFSAPS